MRKFSKVVFWTCTVLAVLLCFTGCGGKDTVSVPAKYYDIVSRQKELFRRSSNPEPEMFLGMQYYQGESVQLRTHGGDVYLYHEDGSKELLAENMPQAAQMLWFLDSEGNYYCWEQEFMLSEVMGQDKKEAYSILKMDPSGTEIYRVRLGQGVRPLDICQLTDDSIILLLENQEDAVKEAAELDPATGKITPITEIRLSYNIAYNIAAGSQGLLLLENGLAPELSEVSLKDGEQLSYQSFASSSYSMGERTADMFVQDLCIREDGSVEILWADPVTAKGVRETLELKEIEKTVIVLATPYTT